MVPFLCDDLRNCIQSDFARARDLVEVNVIYRICHELTAEIKIVLNVSWKILLSEPLAGLVTFFRTSLIQFYLNTQRMSDSFYQITELNKLKRKIRVQNILM